MQHESLTIQNPIIIGGMGGSGTRVIPMLLNEVGVYIGDYISENNDSYLFNYLITTYFFSKKLYTESPDELQKRFEILGQVMEGRLPWKRKITVFPFLVKQLYRQMKVFWNKRGFFRRLKWSVTCIWKMLTADRDGTLWSAKNPSSWLFLEALNDVFPQMRYIHILRDGFDMAFTKNLHHVGYYDLLGMEYVGETNFMDDEHHSLKFESWYRINERAIIRGKRILGDRLLVVNFEDLCLKPRPTIHRMLCFLGVSYSADDLERMVGLIKIPDSIGRSQGHEGEFDFVQKRKSDLIYELARGV